MHCSVYGATFNLKAGDCILILSIKLFCSNFYTTRYGKTLDFFFFFLSQLKQNICFCPHSLEVTWSFGTSLTHVLRNQKEISYFRYFIRFCHVFLKYPIIDNDKVNNTLSRDKTQQMNPHEFVVHMMYCKIKH